MLGRRQEINLQLVEIIDSAIVAASLWVAYIIRAYVIQYYWPDAEVIPPFQDFLWVAAVVVPFMPMMLESRGFYSNILNKTLGQSLNQLGGGLAGVGMILGALSLLMRWTVPSRAVTLIAIPIVCALLLLREAYQRELMRRKALSGEARERVLVAGKDADVENLLATLTPEQMAEVDIRGYVDISEVPVATLVEAMHRQSVSRVIFAAQHVHFAKIEEAVQACETEGVEAWIAADFFQTSIARPAFDVFSGKLMLVFHSTPQVSWALLAKDCLDRLGALLILLVTLPLWLFAAIGIKLTSRGPIFFQQERAGRYGKPFRMWKFRSMHVNAEAMQQALQQQNEMDGPVFKIKADPRIFPFGQLLRKFSIDELPQLINVLRGEMSLVGPRPLPTYEIERIEKHAQRRRLSVKPGLTCLWQVTGRNGITSFDEWVALDLKYIDSWSLWLDLKILAQTLPAVVRGSGAS
jgi:exopolysaccharide biosynthesis polyprenyl glycosylphosphotransferase